MAVVLGPPPGNESWSEALPLDAKNMLFCPRCTTLSEHFQLHPRWHWNQYCHAGNYGYREQYKIFSRTLYHKICLYAYADW